MIGIMIEINRKYTLEVSVYGTIIMLVLFASSCNPLSNSELTKIIQNRFNNPACMIASAKVEVPERPQPVNNSGNYNAYNASVTGSASEYSLPSPSAGPEDYEI